MGDLPKKNGGLIVMGDLPRWKKEEWSHSLGDLPRNRKNMKCSLIVMGDLPRWKKYDEVVSLRWATYPNRKNVKCGLIVMGDLPK